MRVFVRVSLVALAALALFHPSLAAVSFTVTPCRPDTVVQPRPDNPPRLRRVLRPDGTTRLPELVSCGYNRYPPRRPRPKPTCLRLELAGFGNQLRFTVPLPKAFTDA